MSPVIELKEVTKTFVNRTWRTVLLRKKPERTRALDGASFSVQPGEVFGLLGPNGAGKTTLIKILATLVIHDSGFARICGHDPCQEAHLVRQKLGLINTSERSFYWRLTGKQNLDFFASLYNLPGSARARRVNELLEWLGLEEKADIPFMKYSSGQQQRLAIGRSLLGDPQVLLMDEPTRSLDPVAASEFRAFTREELIKKQGKTVLWCTHNLKEAEEMCDRLAIVHKGKAIASGSMPHMRSLIEEGSSYRIRIDHSSANKVREAGLIPVRMFQNNGYIEFEVKAKEENIPSVLQHLVSNGVQVYTCRQKEIDLEEVFEKLVKDES